METFGLFHELVHTRRSIRRWLEDPIPRMDLERMVDCARWAPSDTNAQPWHFTVVTDRALIRTLEAETHVKFAAMGAELAVSGRQETARKLRVFAKYAAHFGAAPALVVVSGEPYDSRFMREVFADLLPPPALARLAQEESVKSTSLAAMNLLLAAHALGYGAVAMTGPVLVIPGELKARLGLAEPFDPHLVIALGRPAGSGPGAVSRKELATVCTWVEGRE